MSALNLNARRLDAWLTREPPEYEDQPVLKCSRCGCFLVREPHGRREFVTIGHCDGKPRVIDCVYDEHADAGILAIIGAKYAGTSYQVAYPPPCGSKKASQERLAGCEIGPSLAHEYEHAPHFFAEDGWDCEETEVRICGHCGHFNEEAIW